MASSFAATEKFRVTMQDNDGSSQRVTVQLSLDGLKILNQDGSRTMRSYNLRNVARWDLMDTSTVIWTKTDVDLEERPLTLSADSNTVRNVVDTLAMCCMQLAEIIQEKDRAAASNLEELASGGGKTKKAQKLPSVDSVQYWRSPDKAGWLGSQAEVMRVWRRRWFVLKQGYLFRFLSPDVSESVKPRGVIDLSKVQDVRDGRAVTGKANSVQLKTASGGSVCYVCESETEMVEWISALEGAIAKIVKQLAGLDDSSEPGGSSSSSRERHSHRSSSSSKDRRGGSSSNSSAAEWAKQVERSLSQGAGSSSSRRGGGGSGMNGSTMVSVVNYAGGGDGSSGSGGYRSSAPPAAAMYDPYSGGSSGGDYGGISSYSQISGAAGLAAGMDDLSLNYGGYPSSGPAAAAAAPSSSTYAAVGARGGSYSSNTGSYGYGGSSGAANAYGGGSSSNAYGYSSSPVAAGYGGGGSSSAYAADGGSAGMYGYGSSSSYSAQPPAAVDPAAAAAGVNGYAAYQQQPQQQQQPAAAGYGYGDGGGYYQQQQQQPPAVSLLDQVPAQQPAYPYYQPTSQAPDQQPAAAAAPPAPAGPSSWQVHHTAEGRPYYYNTATGTTQWEAPPGL